uniref:Uncharacterized protein n=1 Tax=Spongospora subterranea TaxID=70186 RepID=A0A0H5QL24_9EUKA|eukprot:CRZ02717.1 hypothetical protein [Spongospora subterranea]
MMVKMILAPIRPNVWLSLVKLPFSVIISSIGLIVVMFSFFCPISPLLSGLARLHTNSNFTKIFRHNSIDDHIERVHCYRIDHAHDCIHESFVGALEFLPIGTALVQSRYQSALQVDHHQYSDTVGL